MPVFIKILVALIALEHLYILWLEMFAWTKAGKRTFRMLSEELFEPTKVLAANQGLYNGFLAAGLIWSLLIHDAVWSRNIALFFVSCVAAAGVYGGVTASKSIFLKQGVPALAVLLVILIFS
ncbi:MAG: DUF1304 domain-containing protein [Bacteroidota bacterium]|jgi:putative membrane protein